MAFEFRVAVVKRGQWALAVLLWCAGCQGDDEASGIVDYQRDIQPIFAEHCFSCHGSDPGPTDTDLRLDTFEHATAELRSGRRAIVVRNPDESTLIERAETSDRELRMPLLGPKLSDEQIALLRRWVSEGAPYQRHWAFDVPVRPEPPSGSSPIDAFVRDRLHDVGAELSGRADPATLLRRLSFDLTGLPPTIAELDRFEADPSDAAYEELVDQLLASDEHAEHLARDWLDYAGYGDSNGIYLDRPRDMWPWRDWVIQSFRDNRPFDTFVIAQLAGDQLDPEETLATALLRLHPTTTEEGVIEEEYRLQYAMDRANLVGTQLLGITTPCARCHDHKYDPILQRDFYELTACFNRVSNRARGTEPTRELSSPLLAERVSPALAEREEALETLTELRDDEAQETWQRSLDPPQWTPMSFDDAESEQGARIDSTGPGEIDVGGTIPFADTYHFTISQMNGVRALRIDLGDGRRSEEVHLSELRAYVERADERTKVEFAFAFIDKTGESLDAALDGASSTGVEIEEETVILVPAEAIDLGPQERLILSIDQLKGRRAVYDTLSLQTSSDPAAVLPEPLLGALAQGASPAERNELRRVYEMLFGSAEQRRAARRVAELDSELTYLRQAAEVRIMVDDARSRETRLLERGSYQNPTGDELDCNVPEIVSLDSPLGNTNRLGIARWLMSDQSPTTARVLANHYFQVLFRVGLVRTPDDFGARGDAPTHPELLDWLAVEFRESGWNLRQLLRLLVMSETYRQRSALREELDEDSSNEWLGRAMRVRLDAEEIRDQALAVSGLLHRQLGGPPAMPYHPEGLYEAFNDSYGDLVVYRPDRDPGRIHRRALYTFWRRGTPHPAFALLDVPSRIAPSSQRERTNTPTQALSLLNEPLMLEAARHLAARVLEEGGDSLNERIEHAFRLVTSRRPTPDEAQVLSELYDIEHAASGEGLELLQVGASDRRSPGDGSDTAIEEHRVWTVLSRVLLNLSETLTRR